MAPIEQAAKLHFARPSAALETTSKILHIGKGVVVKGEVSAPGNTYIGGRLEGGITTENLIVAPGAVVAARVTIEPAAEACAEDVLARGRFSSYDENLGHPPLGREFAIHTVKNPWAPAADPPAGVNGRRVGENIDPFDLVRRVRTFP
jgi:hypothetical protein